MMNTLRFAALAGAVVLAGCGAVSSSPAPAVDSPADTAVLPVIVLAGDTAVRTDTLGNGLVYYVRHNAEPRNRAELRLVVNAGSVVEDEGQRGLAHFLEHMAFNGTQGFRKHEIVDYLERAGMRFGPDINASTSFDETVFMLQLPTDSAEVVETGLRILRSWATAIELDSAEVDAERGVVIEEWRGRLGAGARVSDRQFPFLFAGSRYAERLPIGDTAVLRRATAADIRRFYEAWYRPELMAVVAVGDFDASQVEARIRSLFGSIPGRPGPAREEATVPPRDSMRTLVTVDPELAHTSVSINWFRPSRRDGTVAEYREGIVESMFAGMLGDRLNDISLLPGAPFLDVSSYLGGSLRPVETFALTASVPQGGEERGLAGVMTELRRAAEHGFTTPELEREKIRFLRTWEQIYAERDKTTSGQFAGQYASHYLYGGRLRTVDDEWAMLQALVPRISLVDVDAAARQFETMRDRTVLVTGPARAGVPPADPARLSAVADSVSRVEVAPYSEPASDAPLMATLPAPGRVVREDSVPEVGVLRWTLSNGARVVLKATDFQDDQVIFAASSPGGLSLVPDSLYLQGRAATAAVQLGGVGRLSLTEMQRRLAGKAASVGSSLGELQEQMSGYAAPRDVETLLQLVHLYFTAPRRDSVAFAGFLERGRELLRNRGATPESAYGDTLNSVLTQGHPRARPYTAATYDSLRLDEAIRIYRERFSDGGDFTFYFVGTFQPDSIRPLVERYLASLPSTGTHEQWRDTGMRTPPGVVKRTVRRGVEPQARTAIVFTGPAAFSRQARSDVLSLADALEIRLRERLREDLGGTYGVGVSGAVTRDPVPRYSFAVEFGAAPERLDELSAVVFAEIDSVRAHGVSADVIGKVVETQRREKETLLRENALWLTALMEYDRMGWDFRWIDDEPLSANLTSTRIRDAARRYLDRSRYVQVSLVPEN